tara:strand:- start:456 stop:1508 length:1053 start_codon:yes stop_codon:yes gene_type:complete
MADWIRPEPLNCADDVPIVTREQDAPTVAQSLCDGQNACVGDLYSTGLAALAEVRRLLSSDAQLNTYEASRQNRRAYRQASHRLLVPIRNREIALRKSPTIGWLVELYPDISDFHLTFPQVQGLNSSWQWYERGVELPGLERRLHPFYGTYFPTRHDHLALFDEWLRSYTGQKDRALDIGTGCGVLAMMLGRAGFSRVLATDTNPNAIESVRRDLKRLNLEAGIEPVVADFLGEETGADLIVFNPPWLPGEPEGPIDEAVYYEEGFFERFFNGAATHMAADARLVMLFSGLAEDVLASSTHPIEAELSSSSRFGLVQKLERAVQPSSKKTRRRKRSVDREKVELWDLQRG